MRYLRKNHRYKWLIGSPVSFDIDFHQHSILTPTKVHDVDAALLSDSDPHVAALFNILGKMV
jgi:hypothetical protein